jgi:translocation protein SEC72
MDTFIALPITLKQTDNQVVPTCDIKQVDAYLQQCHALAVGIKQSGFPAEVPGPPPQSVNPHRSTQVEQAKKQGNEFFGKKQFAEALHAYSMALEMAASRPPWEPSQLANDEIALLLANRSAAFLSAEAYPEAYADACCCVELRKPWPKGYFRKARALVKLGKVKEALETVQAGLGYEPTNEDLLSTKKEVEQLLNDERSYV